LPYDVGVTTLGEAWIDVHANTTPFNRELGLKLKESIRGTDKVVGAESKKTGRKISEGVTEGMDRDSNRIRRSLSRIGTFFDTEGKKWLKNLQKPFEKMSKGNFILTRVFGEMALAAGKVAGKFFDLGRTVFNLARGIGEVAFGLGSALIDGLKNLVGVGGDAARTVTSLSTGFTRIGTALAAAGAELISFLPAVAAVIAVISLLAAALGVLLIVLATVAAPFAALLNFALAIPAALTFFLGALLPLIIALHNISDVMKLVGETDAKKFKDGLKKLSPTLQSLTLALRGLMPTFVAVRDSIQRAFFDPIIKQLGPALKTLGPALIAGLTPVAAALGGMIAAVLRFIASPEIQGFLMTVLPMVGQAIKQMTPALIAILSALAAAAAAAMPMILQLVAKFGDFLIQFAAWIQGAINDGRFNQWLQNANDSLAAIWGLVKALIGLFGTLFSNLRVGGQQFLGILTNAINKFTTWLKSPEGQKAMQNMVILAKLVAQAFAIALNKIEQMLGIINKIADVWRWLRDHNLAPSLGGILNFVSGNFSGGGVVPNDQIAMVHKGEPILDPSNSVQQNQKILSDAGMLDVLSTGQAPEVNVFIGTQRLDERIDFRVGRNNRKQAMALTAGSRR
jgi:hypothetical protein